MKIELIVPNALKDITLGQYQSFVALEDDEGKDDSQNLNHKAIEIFCKIPAIAVRGMKKTDIDFALSGINNIVLEIKNKLNNNEDGDLIRKITLGGVDYGFCPKLDDISEGEYLDINLYMADWQKMHNAMAILYRPITMRKYILGTHLYQIEEYDSSYKYSEIMKDLSMEVVISAMVFFYHLSNELLNAIQAYLSSQTKTTEVQEAMTHTNLHMRQFLQLQAEVFSSYKTLLKPTYMKPLHT